jgi:hypothetical protein
MRVDHKSRMRPVAVRIAAIVGAAAAIPGCFYPPMARPLSGAQEHMRVEIPYDLAWDAVNSVIKQNNYAVRAQDPNHGIIEAQGTSFTPQDADCGEFRSLGGRFAVDPGAASSAEYTFHLKADGPEASIVEVEATFVAPLALPLRPPSSTECVSRGTNEARLLGQVVEQAAQERRPIYMKPVH